MILVSKLGTRIVGTLERCNGIAHIGEVSSVEEFDYTGDTEIWWDEQRTVTRNGLTVFIDEADAEFTADEISAVEDPAVEAAAKLSDAELVEAAHEAQALNGGAQ